MSVERKLVYKYITLKNGTKRRVRREYNEEFKKQMVNLYNAGHTQQELCREYELTPSVLARWIRQNNNSGSFKAKDNRTEKENTLLQLQKENKQLKMENDILKQAALIFGRKD